MLFHDQTILDYPYGIVLSYHFSLLLEIVHFLLSVHRLFHYQVFVYLLLQFFPFLGRVLQFCLWCWCADVDALLEPIKDPDGDSFESFLVEQSLLSGWRDAASVALVALLRSTRVEDSRDQQCKAVWRFIESFQSNEFALSTKSKVLSADDIWPAIVAEDPENIVISWAVGQLDPAVVDGQDFRCHVTAMFDAMEYLADHVPAAAQVMLSLGALEACARIRGAEDIRVNKYIAESTDTLHSMLMEATRPPEESGRDICDY